MKTLVAVAIGDSYVQDTEVMIQTFRQYNPDWSVTRFYNKDLDEILPPNCAALSPFSKCELGRWCALKKTLEMGSEHVLYADGDMMWCGTHASTANAPLVLTPHQILPEFRWMDKERRIGDGIINIGLLEARKDAEELLEVIIRRAVSDMRRFWRKGRVWTQFLMDVMFCFEHKSMALNLHPGANVACWNVTLIPERRVLGTVEHPVVVFQEYEWPLASLHLSGAAKMRKRASSVLDGLLDKWELLKR